MGGRREGKKRTEGNEWEVNVRADKREGSERWHYIKVRREKMRKVGARSCEQGANSKGSTRETRKGGRQ